MKDRKRWRVQCDGHDDAIFTRPENLIVLDGPPPSVPAVTFMDPPPSMPDCAKDTRGTSETVEASAMAGKTAPVPTVSEDVADVSTRSPPSPPTAAEGESPPLLPEDNAGPRESEA